MNKVILFIIYSLLLLFLGRQLAFLPQFSFKSKVKTEDIKKDVIAKFVKTQKGSYSIYYKNLKTGEEFGIDENKAITGASLNKLPIVAYLYNQAAFGKIDLEDKISIQKDDIQDYGTGSIRYKGEGQIYTLKTLTKLALEQSDNTAAYVLGIKTGKDNVQKYISEKLGLKATSMINDRTSAGDMGKILEALYSKNITNQFLTAELLDYMKDTDFEDRLARDIPKNVPIYHKAGDAIGMVHDAGIIEGKNPFVLVVMSSDITDEEDAKKTTGKIAKFIYDQQVN